MPFMMEKWRKSIRHRNKLWKKFTHDPTDANYALYRKQRNKCTSFKAYFLNKSETEKPNQFWNTYRPFLQSKKSRQANHIFLEENGAPIKDKTEIANIFNSYFIHIADAAAEINEADFGTDYSIHPSIQSILINHSSNTMTNFDFEFTNLKQVEKFLLEMNTCKSCGHDLIPPRLLKESASVISEPLAKIMNCSISLGHYPSRWKMGQVTPSFKKGDEFCKNNCRPVSVLPALHNTFERILAKQLEPFYQDILSDFISTYRPNFSCENLFIKTDRRLEEKS